MCYVVVCPRTRRHPTHFMVDFGQTRNLRTIKYYQRPGFEKDGVQFWAEPNAEWGRWGTTQCATIYANSVPTQACEASGRYLFVVGFQLMFMEVEAYALCSNCPANLVSISDTGIGSCRCNAGYTGLDGGTCTQCNSNHYKAGLGPGSCIPCPAGALSPVGSTDFTACTHCSAGTYSDDLTNSAEVGIICLARQHF